jgi:hypothetical protein
VPAAGSFNGSIDHRISRLVQSPFTLMPQGRQTTLPDPGGAQPLLMMRKSRRWELHVVACQTFTSLSVVRGGRVERSTVTVMSPVAESVACAKVGTTFSMPLPKLLLLLLLLLLLPPAARAAALSSSMALKYV